MGTLEKNKAKRDKIETYAYLSKIFEYRPSCGTIYWKTLFPGREAGTIIKAQGYRKIALERLDFKAHRIAWILYYKRKPKTDLVIDHIDGDPSNNAISNLRECHPRDNSRNAATPKNSTTGFKGVSRSGNRFRAYISVNRKQIALGTYETAEDAFAAYVEAAKVHFGEFWSYG